MAEHVRLNKYLAHTLGLSRRQADDEITSGSVRVNGVVARLGAVVQPGRDTIERSNKPVMHAVRSYQYLLLNKPVGYICSRKQQGDTPTIYSLLPRQYQALKVAGRLDKDSCGLVLLTDDGDTIFRLTHPKFGKQKVYTVGLNKPLKADHKKQIQSGVVLPDGISKLEISSAAQPKKAKPNMYTVTMYEGRNRQIRRTFKALGYTVTHLERIKLGAYQLKDLQGNRYLHL